MSISEIANRAADILETQGHVKFDWGEDGTPRCLGGALSQAAKKVRGYSSDYFDVLHVVADITGCGPGNGFIAWNNAPERTAEEVIQVLRDVAIKYQPDEMRSNGEG